MPGSTLSIHGFDWLVDWEIFSLSFQKPFLASSSIPLRRLTEPLCLDDMILVQIGTQNPGRTPEEKQRWNESLKGILKDLRQLNTRDPDVVALAIAKHRREFLQDASRVLNL